MTANRRFIIKARPIYYKGQAIFLMLAYIMLKDQPFLLTCPATL